MGSASLTSAAEDWAPSFEATIEESCDIALRDFPVPATLVTAFTLDQRRFEVEDESFDFDFELDALVDEGSATRISTN